MAPNLLTTPPLPHSVAHAGPEQTAPDASPSGKPSWLRSRQADPISRSMGVRGQRVESREKVINAKGGGSRSHSPSARVWWEGETEMCSPQPSSAANKWLCLIRKPLGNCSHRSPQLSDGTVCMQMVKALIISA